MMACRATKSPSAQWSSSWHGTCLRPRHRPPGPNKPHHDYLHAKAAAGSVGAAFPQDGFPQQSSSATATPAQAGGASFPATVFNLVNVIMGAGYVSIPYACRQGGWAALPVLWLLGAVFCYTGNTILQCCELLDKQQQQKRQKQQQQQQHQQQQQLLQQQQQPAQLTQVSSSNSSQGSTRAAAAAPSGYEDVAEAAFGRLGRLLVSGLMYAELLGICCVYVVLEAEALSTLLGHTPLGAWLASACGGGSLGFIAAASCLVLPTVLLPSVEALAALGALGVAAAVTVGCVVAGLFASTPASLTGLSGTSLLQAATLPQVLGILAFVYAGHSTFPVIQQSMADARMGRRAVTLGYAATAAICTLIGGAGYALWGTGTQQVVTANLVPGSLLALVLTGLTAANPFSAFAVTLEPVALVLQRRLWRPRQQQQQQQVDHSSSGGDGSNPKSADNSSGSSDGQVPYPVRAGIRLGLALACCATAALLPYVTDLMAFVGALLTMSISLILPALMHLRLLGQLHAQQHTAAAAATASILQGEDRTTGTDGGAAGVLGVPSSGSNQGAAAAAAAAAAVGPEGEAKGQSGAPGSASVGGGVSSQLLLLLCLDVAVVLLGVGCAYVGASSAAASLQQKLGAVAAVG